MLRRLLALRAPPPVPADTEWRRVLEYAGVALGPLVLQGVRQGRAGTTVPPWAEAELRRRTSGYAALQIRKLHALRAVCRALDGAGISSLLLKGTALAHSVYPQPWLRPTRDVDCWVAPAQLDGAAAALGALGFVSPADLALHDAITQSPLRRILESADSLQRIELHAAPSSLTGLDWARFDVAFGASEPVRVAGEAMRMLGPEHQLTHLGLHLSRAHAFDLTLLHLVDIAVVVERGQARWDWTRLMADWTRQGVGIWMTLVLVLARDLLGAPIPGDIEQLAAPAADWETMRRLAEERLWNTRADKLPDAVSNALRQPSGAGKLRWLKRRLIDFYWHEPQARGPLEHLRSAGRKLWYDLHVKVPRYVVAWRRGAFSHDAVATGLTRVRQGNELEAMVVGLGGVGYSDENAPTAPIA